MSETILGKRYRLLEQIGEGGMAVVYKALDTLLGRPVAVKVLRPQYAADPDFLARFLHEAQAAGGLVHPNIVNVLDVGEDAGQNYIVMEYVPGHTLKEIIVQRGPLTVGESLDIASQVCSAVDFAHRKGLVHRDIKPQNVLVNADGLAKVADFGLAEVLTAASPAETEAVLGTVHYLSPEQAQGLPATQASDVYAIGVVLYEMLTGRLPFDGATPEEVVLKQIQQEPPPPHLVNGRLPLAVDGFVLKALAKDPAKRYTSARELGSALQAYRQMGEGRTMPYRPVRDAGKPGNRETGNQETGRPVIRESGNQETGKTATRPATPVTRSAPRSSGFDCLLAFLVMVALACVLGLIPLGLLVRETLAIPTPTPLPEVVIPNLVGLDYGEAESRLQALGLVITPQGDRFDDKIPAGKIAAQTVPANTRVKWGEEVGVILSKGMELFPVPDLVGLPFNDALERLTRAGLSTHRQEAPSPSVAVGLVISQTPAATKSLARGGVVTVTVSLGNKVLVPDLMGKEETEAQQIIRDLGLNTTFVNYQDPDVIPASERWRLTVVKAGQVLSNTPLPGTLVERGTTIYLAVRKR